MQIHAPNHIRKNGTRYTFELRAVDDDGVGASASASTALAASPSSVVAVPDAQLRDLLAFAARTGNAPITQGDLAKLTTLSGGGDITDLTGLEFALNLELLLLKSNRIDDISALSSLHALSHLDLSYNQISDVSALAGLTKLREIELNHNAISDVSGLPVQDARTVGQRYIRPPSLRTPRTDVAQRGAQPVVRSSAVGLAGADDT